MYGKTSFNGVVSPPKMSLDSIGAIRQTLSFSYIILIEFSRLGVGQQNCGGFREITGKNGSWYVRRV